MKFDHALFVDRDGTIIKDCEGALNKSNIEFEHGLEIFLRFAIKKKFRIVMVTNQTAVSRGLISMNKMIETNSFLTSKIDKLLGQKVFDEIFICPFHPDAQISQYRLDSDDRKPKPGMIFKAQKKLNLNLKKSIMVGDRISDIVSGNLAGCTTILKINKFSKLKIIKSNLKYSKEMEIPNYKVNKLLEIIPIMEKLV